MYKNSSKLRPWFPPGPKFVFTVGVNHFHVLSWSGNNTSELCCIMRSHHLYSQPNCSLYCTLYSCRYSCYSFRFSFLCHSFTVRTYACIQYTVFWISNELCWQLSHCQQKSHSLQALQELDGRLLCLSFQLTEDISYCYIMLLIHVLNLTV